ncbi:pseudouridine synthase [Neoconidiobolus thromboides FSU 785]|nr:pseudouridine synthase [Neoconidiobolus thromboides FSU 785]
MFYLIKNGFKSTTLNKRIVYYTTVVTSSIDITLKTTKKSNPQWPIFIIEESWGTSRVDTYLRNRLNLEFSLTQKLLRLKKVAINGKKQKEGSYKIQPGDELVIKERNLLDFIVNEEKKMDRRKDEDDAPLPFDIVFQNKHLILINKPKGLPVQGGSKLMDHIGNYFEKIKGNSIDKPRIVHRLDKEVTGALILAKTHKSSVILSDLFHGNKSLVKTADSKLIKYYLAITHHQPKSISGLITDPIYYNSDGTVSIQKNNNSNLKIEKKESITEYKVLQTNEKYSLLALKLLTGRKHQLRLHLAHSLNTPILGDKKYSNNTINGPLMLHCLGMDLMNKELINDEDFKNYQIIFNNQMYGDVIEEYVNSLPNNGLKLFVPPPSHFMKLLKNVR